MLYELRTFYLGVAAILATALVLILMGRRNWRHVDPAIALLFATGCAYHVGVFFHSQLDGSSVDWLQPLQSLSTLGIVVGVSTMPSALLHSVLRMRRPESPPRFIHHALVYVPALVAIPAMAMVIGRPDVHLLAAVQSLVVPYVTWMVVAVTASGLLLLSYRPTYEYQLHKTAALMIAVSLFLAAALLMLGFGIIGRERLSQSNGLAMFMALPPFLPGTVFTYLIIRYGFMRLMVDQSVVYAVILLALLLFHQVLVGRATAFLMDRIGIDFAVLEVGALGAIALLWSPLRQRTSEALRYLMGNQVASLREDSQQLAIALAGHHESNPQALLAWLVPRLRELLNLPFVIGCFADCQPITVGNVVVDRDRLVDFDACLRRQTPQFCNRQSATDSELLDHLSECEADAALCTGGTETPDAPPALLVFGRPPLGPSMNQEQLSAARLLAKQFSITLQNRALQEQAATAERQAMQNEKLKTLGMLSSCMAHEVKNPLSTIRTIACVMLEQLSSDSEHAADLQMIVAEVDRLMSRTQELLSFARPAESGQLCESVARVVEAITGFLAYKARSNSIMIETSFDDHLGGVPAEENVLRDILFNLIGNSVDAAKSLVKVDCRREDQSVSISVTDDGPGVAPEVAHRLFEPFLTTKADGTGLGLYIVQQRALSLDGEITFQSHPPLGTTFTLRLPAS